jgi:ferredoxin
MTEIMVDKETCIGCKLCTALCPECFEIGSNDKAEVICTICVKCDLLEVAAKCPVNAITVR